ncbi:MAG TPA: hypothetical protein VLF59_05035 [Candidatus Saccharimonadales bacterium]|nr:hypothetical protein [Candidatus Saccharimonadales bacterium]
MRSAASPPRGRPLYALESGKEPADMSKNAAPSGPLPPERVADLLGRLPHRRALESGAETPKPDAGTHPDKPPEAQPTRSDTPQDAEDHTTQSARSGGLPKQTADRADTPKSEEQRKEKPPERVEAKLGQAATAEAAAQDMAARDAQARAATQTDVPPPQNQPAEPSRATTATDPPPAAQASYQYYTQPTEAPASEASGNADAAYDANADVRSDGLNGEEAPDWTNPADMYDAFDRAMQDDMSGEGQDESEEPGPAAAKPRMRRLVNPNGDGTTFTYTEAPRHTPPPTPQPGATRRDQYRPRPGESAPRQGREGYMDRPQAPRIRRESVRDESRGKVIVAGVGRLVLAGVAGSAALAFRGRFKVSATRVTHVNGTKNSYRVQVVRGRKKQTYQEVVVKAKNPQEAQAKVEGRRVRLLMRRL